MIPSFPEAMSDIRYISSGRFVSSDEWIHPKRIIDSYEIIYVVEGHIHVQQDEEKISAGEGEIIILQPFKTHFGYQKSTGRNSFYWVHYTDPGMYTFYQINTRLRIQEPYHFNLLFKQLLHVANSPEYPAYTASLMIWLILTEIAAKQQEQNRNGSPMLKDLCEWIRINSEKKLTVQDVAQEAGYSVDYIARLFKKTYSIGLKEYIGEMKMNWVKNRLLDSSCPIKQISSEAGFEDYKNFLKFFKYHEGMSPLEFRKTYFNTHLNKK